MRVAVSLIAGLLLAASLQQVRPAVDVSTARSPNETSALSLGQHPRLFMTPGSVASFRSKMASSDWREEFQAFLDYGATRIGVTIAGEDSRNLSADVMNMAFIHAIGIVPGGNYRGHAPSAYGARVVAMVQYWIDRGSPPNFWRVVYPDPMKFAYDWCFDQLNAVQKTAIVAYLKTLPDDQHNCPTDYYGTAYRSNAILDGLAYGNDGIDDAAAAKAYGRYNVVGHAPGTGSLDGYSFISGSDGGFSNLWTYSTVEMTGMMPLLMMLEGWRAAHGLTRAETFGASYADVLRTYPAWAAYRIRPWGVSEPSYPGGRRYMLRADAANMVNPVEARWAFNASEGLNQVLKASTIYSGTDTTAAALSRWLLEQRIGDTYPSAAYGWSNASAMLSDFLLGSKETAARSPSQLGLPLTKLFAAFGKLFTLTAWDDPAATYVTYWAQPWHRGSSGTTNDNPGAITIDRKGPLLVTAGSGGHHQYAGLPMSSSIPVFVDPNESPRGARATEGGAWWTQWDMGGPRRTTTIDNYTNVATAFKPGTKYDFGTGINRFRAKHGAGEDLDYAFADITHAYNSTRFSDGINTVKVSNVTRQLFDFPKQSPVANDIIVVCDRQTTTAQKFLKRNFWHVSAEPAIDGTATAVRDGLTIYAGATLATVTNRTNGSDGRLFITPMYPATLRKVGGPGAGGVWSQVGAPGVVHDRAATGVQTLMASSGSDRTVQIWVNTAVAFSNGSGVQPSFSIGQTGNPAKFAEASEFAGSALGAIKVFTGTLSSGAALIVTATAGTSTTSTGTIQVQAAIVGHEFEDPYGNIWWNQFQTENVPADDAQRQYYAPYRLEIESSTAATADTLLTVLEVGNARAMQSPTESWPGTNFKAVRVGNRIAACSAGEALRVSGTLVLQKAGTYRLAIADLDAPASRTLSGGTNIASLTTIYDDASAHVRYVTVVVKADGAGAENTVSIS